MSKPEELAQELVDYLDKRGYVVAPKEATQSMIDAGVAMALQVSVHGQGGWSKYVASLYSQMLSQRPK